MDINQAITAIFDSQPGDCARVTTFFLSRNKPNIKYGNVYIEVLDDGYGSYNCQVRTLDGTVFIFEKCSESIEEAIQGINWDAIDDGTADHF